MVAEFDDKRDVDRQIVDLQSKLAFQEDTVQVLNEMVSEQQQDILSLKAQMRTLLGELRNILDELKDETTRLSDNEKPPHY